MVTLQPHPLAPYQLPTLDPESDRWAEVSGSLNLIFSSKTLPVPGKDMQRPGVRITLEGKFYPITMIFVRISLHSHMSVSYSAPNVKRCEPIIRAQSKSR